MTNEEKRDVETRAFWWIINGKTGESSITIFAVMVGVKCENHYPGHPYDSGDFGRCSDLLRLIPEWRERLPEVSALYPEWRGLVEHWDELEALYQAEKEADRCPGLYERMCELDEDYED
jgi:hypothetical protein